MIAKVKQKIKNNKKIVENFSYLSLLQLFNMLLPLVTYPYLIRVLGLEIYGKIVVAQVIVTYIGIFIDFGFRVSATKNISLYRDDKVKLSTIVSSVLQIKIVLWTLSLLILLGVLFFLPITTNDKLLYLFSFAICFNELLFPQWYFQGVERMKYITLINLITRSFFVILTFLFIRSKSDYLYVPALNGIGVFLGGVIGLYVVFRKDKVTFIWQEATVLKYYIKDTFPILLSNVIIAVKDKFNIIFLATGMGLKEVAVYDLATKIMKLVMQPIDIVNTTIYPKVSREKNMNYMLKVTKLTFITVVVGVLVLQPFLPYIIQLIDKDLHNAILPTRILLLAPIVMVWSLAFGRNCLLANGEYKIFTTGMLLTTLFYLLITSIAYLLEYFNFVMTFVVITLLTYLFELLYRWYMAKRCKFI